MKKSTQPNNKTTFGKRKGGKPAKTYNKHDKKERSYRGQGR
jgi:hypothetical protein